LIRSNPRPLIFAKKLLRWWIRTNSK